MAHSSQIEDEVDALYGLRPGEFVAARDALAKQVRRSGDREGADRIKALGRPSAAAWAVNQLARREPEWTQALVTAGQRMTEAHAALLEHGDRDGWRQASAEARQAIERLVRLAEGLLREERGSVSAQLREQVRETLQAATMDPQARDLVAAGRLSRELRPPGGMPDAPSGRVRPAAERPSGTGPRGTIPRRRSRSGSSAEQDGAAEAAAEREARDARRAAERDARALLRRAERERGSAATAAERAAQALLRAQKAREAAAEELASARRADEERAGELGAAEAAHAEAQAQLEARDQAIAEARETLDGLAGSDG